MPLSAGAFGFDDYVDHVIRFLERIGPGAHLLAVCQPCAQALAAVAHHGRGRQSGHAAQHDPDGRPGRHADQPDRVNDLAMSQPIDWFEGKLIATVPARYRGAGRRVYPGFVQLTAFMAMNLDRHVDAHHRHVSPSLPTGRLDEAEAS